MKDFLTFVILVEELGITQTIVLKYLMKKQDLLKISQVGLVHG